MGDDRRAGLAEILVTAGMVKMIMRVDDEAHRLRVQRLHGRGQFGGDGRELIVNDHVAIGAKGDADVAACSEDHGHARSKVGGGHGDLRGIHRRRRARRCAGAHQDGGGHGDSGGCGDFIHVVLTLMMHQSPCKRAFQ